MNNIRMRVEEIVLNEAGRNEEGFEVYDWAFIIRALPKMQSRGEKLLEYIRQVGEEAQK